MIEQIRKLLKADHFVPFLIYTSSGRQILVPSHDHILVGKDAVTVLDITDGLFAYISALHITEIKPTGETSVVTE
jgi:hypothetical protein